MDSIVTAKPDWQRLIHMTIVNDVQRAIIEWILFDSEDEKVKKQNYDRIKSQTLSLMASMCKIKYPRLVSIAEGAKVRDREQFELAVAACAFTPYTTCRDCGVPEEHVNWKSNNYTGTALLESLRRTSNG